MCWILLQNIETEICCKPSWSRNLNLDLCRSEIKYRNKSKNRDVAEIKYHLIDIKWLKYAYRQNGHKRARVMVAYLWEDMWRLHTSEMCYNEAWGPFYYWTIRENPNLRRCNTKSLWAPLGLIGQPTSWGRNLGIWSPFDAHDTSLEIFIWGLQPWTKFYEI